MASIRPLPRNRGYHLDFRVDGKRHRRHLVGFAYKEAEALRKSIDSRITLHRLGLEPFRFNVAPAPNSLSLRVASDRYRKDCSSRIAPSTLQIYVYATQDLIDCFGDVPLMELDRSGYPRLLKHLETHLNPTSINMRLRAIRAFFHWLTKYEYLERMPFEISLVQVERGLPKFLTPEELERIFAVVDDPALLSTYRVYLATGIRRSELHNSRLEAGHLHLRKTKGKQERLVPIPRDLEEDYWRAMTAQGSRPYTATWITHSWTRYRRKAGVKDPGKTVHALRHTFALRLLARTGDVYLVKEALGHSSVAVTEVYLKFPKEYLKQLFGKLGPTDQ